MAAQTTAVTDSNARERRNGPAASVGRPGHNAPAMHRDRHKEKASGILAPFKNKQEEMERHAWFRVTETVVDGFSKDRVMENAAAMTYYGVFSLFPILLLFMSILGLVLQSNQAAQQQVMNAIARVLPTGQDQLRSVIQGVIAAKGTAAGIGIVTLLWSALGFFQVIDRNVNEIWGVTKARSFIKGKLLALAMMLGIGGVALASFVATGVVTFLSHNTGGIPGSAAFWQIVVSVVSFLAVFAVFYALYRYAPQRDLEWKDIWLSALITAFVWEATRRLLSFYIQRNNMLSGYGTIGAAMALLFWIYVASIVILLGAELAYAIAKDRRNIPVEKQMRVIAPPGEQPTPKFAPQIGAGQSTGKDQREPIAAEDEALPHERPVDLAPIQIKERREGLAGRPKVVHRPVTPVGEPPAWMRSSVKPEEPAGPEDERVRLSELPVAAALSAGASRAFGWFKRDRKHVA